MRWDKAYGVGVGIWAYGVGIDIWCWGGPKTDTVVRPSPQQHALTISGAMSPDNKISV